MREVLTLGPRYRAITLLAKGGMGAVYLGQRVGEGEGKLVAIKVMHAHIADTPDTVALFIDEARIGARIDHPNVVRVLDTDVAEDTPFIVMEYVEGLSLVHLLRALDVAKERLPAAAAARIVYEVLLGLEAAHSLGAVHRDVSPHNVIVGVDGRSRITDFGVATFTGRLSATRPGNVRGKLSYMSPEQVSRTGVVDGRSDCFSAGIVLWELLTGRELFASENEAETLAKVLREPIPPPSSFADVPEALEDVCMKALERSLERRYESAKAFAEALAGALTLLSHQKIAALVAQHGAHALERQRAARASVALAPLASDRFASAPPPVADPHMPLGGSTLERSGVALEPVSPKREREGGMRLVALGAGALVLVVLGTILGRVSGRAEPAPAATSTSSRASAEAIAGDAPAIAVGPAVVAASSRPSSTSSSDDVQGTSAAPTTTAPATPSRSPSASPRRPGSRGHAAGAASSARPSASSPPARRPGDPFIPGEL
jgi:serine/threonine-protein kinase